MRRPENFDAASIRGPLGFDPDDLVLVFIALGHFERKGLPLLLDAMRSVADKRVKLVVVGGTSGTIKYYQKLVEGMGLDGQVKFVGIQSDVRPYLWASDIFAFPSAYETFSMVSFEAAAAGLPLLVSHLYGVEDMLVDGVNGWCVERTAQDVAEKIRFALGNRSALQEMGQKASARVSECGVAQFVEKWRALYAEIEASLDARRQHPPRSAWKLAQSDSGP